MRIGMMKCSYDILLPCDASWNFRRPLPKTHHFAAQALHVLVLERVMHHSRCDEAAFSIQRQSLAGQWHGILCQYLSLAVETTHEAYDVPRRS